MMHDDLVSRLRNAAKISEALAILLPHGDGNATAKLYNDAADAIEALSLYESLYRNMTEKGQQTAQKLIDAYPKWISVEERLPEKTNNYLVHIECKCDGELMSKWTQVAWFCKKFYWEHSHDTEFFEETVTHWMPLPEPPKEE